MSIKSILLCSILIIYGMSFTLVDPIPFSSLPFKASNLKQCSSTQKNSIYSAVANCQTQLMLDTIQCVCKYMNKTLNQSWNGFVKTGDPSNVAAVAYWTFNQCQIVLKAFGRFNRTYIFWPAVQYTQSNIQMIGGDQRNQKLVNKQKSAHTFTSKNPVITGDCPAASVSAVNAALVVCQKESNQETANCIKDELNKTLLQKWDSYVASYGICALSANCFDSCGLFFSQYGKYNFTMNIWKAEHTESPSL